MPELEQHSLGPYFIERHLARGGMSDIYLAKDTRTLQPVVIKLVHSSNREHCERFRREIATSQALKHEHILPALDHGEFEAWVYMVTPYIAAGTLKQRLQEGALDLEEAGNLLDQLASALHYAHGQGILHRDIKPSNILLQDGTHAYLTDFGLVKKVGDETDLTLSGYLIGTPEYMAPELADESVTVRSDVYALGIVLYQMLTGHVPFTGSTPIGIYLKHIRERPTPPSHLRTDLPRSIERVVLQALEKDPQRRFQSAQEFAEAYQQALKLAQGHTLTLDRLMLTRLLSQENELLGAGRRKPRKVSPRQALLASLGAAVFVVFPTLLGSALYSWQAPAASKAALAPSAAAVCNAPNIRPALPSAGAGSQHSANVGPVSDAAHVMEIAPMTTWQESQPVKQDHKHDKHHQKKQKHKHSDSSSINIDIEIND
ncbi:serine/threonine protein kinase [Ktedonosporobacter rubrisoli]|uniref:non-specific serine/threonine protein kinase n=1 Tax=Ktedonosporobacter rubrisoli TaxID=2509675 RepID=A0A4P6JVN7_KTERU|nr:serine/threonine-protein kinase [Ktedonosporobacter rubrisoli]QBD79604.1 serine/threonine protein kinase [Ktedonosporobacter rubrisoli]